MANARIFDIKRGVLSTTDAGTATLDIPVPTSTVLGFSAIIVPKIASTGLGGIVAQNGAANNVAGVVTVSGTTVSLAGFAGAMTAGLATATAVFSASGTNLRLTVTGVAAIGVVDWQYQITCIIN